MSWEFSDYHIFGTLIVVLIFLVTLFFVKIGVSGFHNDDVKQKYQKAKFLYDNNRLTYKNLKRDCPECTNVEYIRIKTQLQEGKLVDI